MASVFKRRAGLKAPRYYVQYRGADGAVHRVSAGRDKNASLAMATEIERRVQRERSGLADPHEGQVRRPVREHLDDFIAVLRDRQRSPIHVHAIGAKVRAILDGIGARTVADLRPSRVEAFLGDLGAKGRSRKTLAHYVGAVSEFSRWLLHDGRIGADPLVNLPTFDADADRRHVRRALDDEEQRRLVHAAETSDRTKFGLTGRDRALIYKLALSSGLRANELATLTVGCLTFGDAPTVTVEAKNAKNRKRETLPLRPDVADALRAYVGIRTADEMVFPKNTWSLHAARVLRVDLAAAGIPYRDDAGRVVDLHALRHTFITNLARAGVPPQIAQRLARHSDVRLTLGVYSHLGLVDLAGALAKLPGLDVDVSPQSLSAVANGTSGLRANLSLPGAISGDLVPSRETGDTEKGNLGIAPRANDCAPVQAAANGRDGEEGKAGEGNRTLVISLEG